MFTLAIKYFSYKGYTILGNSYILDTTSLIKMQVLAYNNIA
jgi:hypothetical protein